MKLSVALSTYNGEKYIEKQLQSILNQKLPVDEVVISDDGSTDSTIDIVNRFVKDNNLEQWTVHINRHNIGYAHNFIQTVLKTTGDIVFLCDQDDLWGNTKTEEIVQIFEQHSNLWMLHTDIDLIDEQDKIISSHYDKLKHGYKELSFDDYARRLNYCGMASAFRGDLRDVLADYDLTDIPTHDWILGAIACLEGVFATDDIVLSQRRKHSSNAELKHNNQKASKTDRIKYIELYNSFYRSLIKAIEHNKTDMTYEIEWLRQRVELNIKRIYCLENCKILSMILLIKDIHLFPTPKAFISDIRYLFR